MFVFLPEEDRSTVVEVFGSDVAGSGENNVARNFADFCQVLL
jgi:hypothetical protein